MLILTNRNVKHFCIPLLLLIFHIPIYAYNLKQITSKDKLSNSSVTSFYQDSRGLMWIGTCEGLNMYNGRRVVVYNPNDSTQVLTGSTINKIIETGTEVLWIQTKYGLDRLNTKTGVLHYFGIFDKTVFIEKDRYENLYIINEDNCIYCFSNNSTEVRKIELPELLFADVLNFYIDDSDRLFIFTRKGEVRIYKLENSDSGIIQWIEERIYNYATEFIFCFGKDQEAVVVDKNCKLYAFDAETGAMQFIYNVRDLMTNNGSISSIIKHHEDYFVGFKVGGLYNLKKSKRSYVLERFPINCGIFNMVKDKHQDIVWIGTDGQGVYIYSNDTYSIRSTHFDKFTIPLGRPIRALFLDDRNTLWLGSKGDGVVKINDYDINKDIHDCAIEHLTSFNSSLCDNAVFSFSKSRHNGLWIGTEGGLNYYSYDENKMKGVLLTHNELSINKIHDIYDQDSVLWLATVGTGGIKAKVEWKGNFPTLKVMDQYIMQKGEVSANNFFSIYPGKDDLIYFANRGGGLVEVNARTSGVKVVKFDTRVKNDVLNEINSIAKDGDDKYLLGSNYGLIEWNGDCYYQIYNKLNGFPSNVIHYVLSDSNSNYWLSTNQGIVNYDTNKKTFRIYDDLNGLSITEFSDGAAFKDERRGTMFFGGINGFISITKEDYIPKDYMPPIHFDRLTLFGKNYDLQNFISIDDDEKALKLHYDQNFFSISFIAVDYLNGNNYSYHYKLDGLNNEWIDNGYSNSISFTNFSPGDYTLLVKYHNRFTGKESSAYSIHIIVLPPWYRSNIAYFTYFLLALLLASLTIRIIYLKNKKKRLQALSIIEQQHKEDVYESKLRFFTNIAHEFCTPLTLISGPCNRILSQRNVDHNIIKYAKVIQNNAERLNSLIQDLIEFRQIETGYQQPQVEKLCISDIISQIGLSFIDVAESRDIDFENNLPNDILWNSDKRFFTTIIINLLSNAFKYTVNKGHVFVEAYIIDNNLHLTISNTGKGIKEKDISKMFDRYSILDDFEKQDHSSLWSRNGLGLAISYSMINLLQAQLDIESAPTDWTCFKLVFPFLEVNTAEAVKDYVLEKQIVLKESDTTSLPKHRFDKSKPTILAIDNEMDMLWLIGDIFAEDFNIIPVVKKTEAFTILGEIHPNIILCDISFQDMDGITFTKELKNNPQTAHIPLILISAKHEIEEQIEGLDAGAEIYITKPFNVDYLKTSVKQLIGRKEVLKDYFASPYSAFELAEGKLMHKEHKKLIKDILNIINKNIRNKELTVTFIATRMNMSTRNLYRKVSEISNVSITDMIHDCRLHIAQDLLMQSKLTIDEILFKSGFSNRVSFFKIFSKKYRCTPKEYRERNQPN